MNCIDVVLRWWFCWNLVVFPILKLLISGKQRIKLVPLVFSSSRYDFCWHAMLAAQWNEKLCTGDTIVPVWPLSRFYSQLSSKIEKCNQHKTWSCKKHTRHVKFYSIRFACYVDKIHIFIILLSLLLYPHLTWILSAMLLSRSDAYKSTSNDFIIALILIIILIPFSLSHNSGW